MRTKSLVIPFTWSHGAEDTPFTVVLTPDGRVEIGDISLRWNENEQAIEWPAGMHSETARDDFHRLVLAATHALRAALDALMTADDAKLHSTPNSTTPKPER